VRLWVEVCERERERERERESARERASERERERERKRVCVLTREIVRTEYTGVPDVQKTHTPRTLP
jgi:hypothetical protein